MSILARLLARISIAYVVVLASHPIAAQIPGSDANGIVRRANMAMGCDLVQHETAISIQGTLTASSLASPMHIRIDTQGNDRVRSELDTPKERKTTIINEGKGQIQHGDGRVTALAEHNTSHQRPMHIPCLTKLTLGSGHVEATYVRSEVAGADTLDVIDLELTGRPKEKRAAALMKTTVWISRSTGFLAKLQYVNAAEQDANDTQLVEIEYAGYRRVDGLAIPFHQLTHSGALTLNLQIESAQLNAHSADFNLR
jgi:hypothetical protein